METQKGAEAIRSEEELTAEIEAKLNNEKLTHEEALHYFEVAHDNHFFNLKEKVGEILATNFKEEDDRLAEKNKEPLVKFLDKQTKKLSVDSENIG